MGKNKKEKESWLTDAERIAYKIYAGDAGELAGSVVELELVMERDRSRSVEAFAKLLRDKLIGEGYIVISDIDHMLEDWHEEEVLRPADFS